MGMIKNISQRCELNNLEKIEDSVQLCLILFQLKKMTRVIPYRQLYPDPRAKEAQKPKQIQSAPADQQIVGATGMYMWINREQSSWRFVYLALVVFGLFFFLLFRVWPEWLRIGVWYVSWYMLVFLIGMAVVRAIVWFLIFHIGFDFWIFPNYFIESNNPLDSFFPLWEGYRREDMFEIRMGIVRVASAFCLFYSASEFLKEPENLDNLMSGSTEVWNDVFEWGQNKFLGVPDNTTAIQTKKSARQIYAEAFMEDETNSMFGMGGKRFYEEEPDQPRKSNDDLGEDGEDSSADNTVMDLETIERMLKEEEEEKEE